MYYISVLSLDNTEAGGIIESFKKFLYASSDLKVAAIRFIVNDQ